MSMFPGGAVLLAVLLIPFSGCMTGLGPPQAPALVSGCIADQEGFFDSDENTFSAGAKYTEPSSACDATYTATWAVTSEQARVGVGGKINDGTLYVLIEDGDFDVLFEETFDDSNEPDAYLTSVGTPGDWTITLTADGLNGEFAITINAL